MVTDAKFTADSSQKLPVLQPQRLYKQIAEVLEERINGGAFPPGAYLPPERELAQQMGVSRTSVREALIALEVKGRIVIRVGDGAQVCEALPADKAEQLNDRSPLEQLEARSLIEGEIAALAAKNATTEHLHALEQTLESMQTSLLSPADFRAADHAFHVSIAMAAGNQVLLDQLEYLWALRDQTTFRKFEEHYTSNEREQFAVLEDHRQIVEAIRSGKASQARTAVKKHLARVQKVFVK